MTTGAARRPIGALKSSGRFLSIQRVPSAGVSAPPRDDALAAEEHGESDVLPTPRSNHQIFYTETIFEGAAYRKSCMRAGALLSQTAAKMREISWKCDELARGAGGRGEVGLGRIRDREGDGGRG